MAIRSIIRTASLAVVAVATLIGSAGAGPLEVALVEKVSGDSNGVDSWTMSIMARSFRLAPAIPLYLGTCTHACGKPLPAVL
jgi:hypothetical protein